MTDTATTEPTGADLIESWAARSGAHRYAGDCPICDEDCTRIGITRLAYVFETCHCDAVDYPHLVERICHVVCLADRGGDLAALELLQSAAWVVGRYKCGQETAARIGAFLAERRSA